MAAKLLFSSFIFGISFLLAPKAQAVTPAPVAAPESEFEAILEAMEANGKKIEELLHGIDARLLSNLKAGYVLTEADIANINTVVRDARLQREGEAKGRASNPPRIYTFEDLNDYRSFIESMPAELQAQEREILERELTKLIEEKARAYTDPYELSKLRSEIARTLSTKEQYRLHGLVLDQAELLSTLLKNEKWWNSFWRTSGTGAGGLGAVGVLVGVFFKSSRSSVQIAGGGVMAVAGLWLYLSHRDRKDLSDEIAEFDRLIANEREDLALLKEAVEIKAPN